MIDSRAWAILAGMVCAVAAVGVADSDKPNAVEDRGPIDVYLVAGQSNADGRADYRTLPTALRDRYERHEGVLFYHGATRPERRLPAGRWIPLGPGSGTNFANDGRGDADQINFGPEVGLGHALRGGTPERLIALLKYAPGGTSLADDWSPGSGRAWKRWRSVVDAGFRSLVDAGYEVRLKGMTWSQGEKDSQSGGATDAYRDNLRAFLAAVREAYGADLPIVVTGLRLNDAADREIADAQSAVAEADARAAFVPTDDLTFMDAVHLDAPGQLALGVRCAEALAELNGDPASDSASSVGWTPQARKLLGIDDEQLERLTRAGLIHIAPVHLPTEADGACNHYGWPIATMVDGTIIVMHRRIPGHNRKGAGDPNESMSYGIVLRSEDGGQTWSEPYDLRDSMTPADRTRGGLVPLSHRKKFDPANMSPLGYKIHLHAIGATRDGAVVAINNHGVFRTEDAGRTWKHFSTALREDTFRHEMVNIGPTVVDDPDRGLLVFGNWFGEVDTYHKLSNDLVVLRSPDGGATWSAEDYPVGFPQYEPAVIKRDDTYLFVTRDQTKVRAHKQMTWKPGEKPRVIDTNLADPRLVDTVDFSLNPVTGRYEIVRSERHHMELWLWSIAPDEWETGQWRRECRLLKSDGRFYADADGFHPASAVIDRERGVQHVFIYVGHPNGPAGVYRITRSLDTPGLVKQLDVDITP